jgi:NodT family efflux transporter outer membrane factor (OMF) lipoprotein
MRIELPSGLYIPEFHHIDCGSISVPVMVGRDNDAMFRGLHAAFPAYHDDYNGHALWHHSPGFRGLIVSQMLTLYHHAGHLSVQGPPPAAVSGEKSRHVPAQSGRNYLGRSLMERTTITSRQWELGFLLCALLTGCTVGPKYRQPAVATPPTFKEAPAAAPPANSPTNQTQDNAAPNNANQDNGNWAVAQPADAKIRGDWWAIFNEPELNDLEAQVNINNQNIKLYFENFMEARALVGEARALYFPTVTAGPSYSRQRSSNNLGSTSTTANPGKTSQLYSLPLDVSWTPDLFGRIRNQVHAAQYSAQVSAADLENEKLTEQADLAEYYFEIRGQDTLIDLLTQTVATYQKSLDLTQAQYDTGIGDQISVETARNTLQSAQASLTSLGISRAQYEHAIAVLLGKPASSFSLPKRGFTTAPPPIPIGVPSLLLQRRPDVAAAERTMASANANLGVAYSAFYPSLTISATGGFESYLFKHLADWPSRFWSVGPAFSQPIFNAALKADLHQYVAIYNQDVATYRQTVLTAFQQVEDYLAQTRILSQEIQQQRAAVESAKTSLNLEMGRYETGIDPYLDVVTLQSTVLSDEQTVYNLQIEQMTGAVELVEALGGGWDTSQLPTPAQVSQTPSKADTQIQR